MTANKAIEMIDEYLLEPNCIHKDWVECLRLCRKVLEKQMKKKPIRRNPICYAKSKDGEELYSYDYYCPICDTQLEATEHHCVCGQALDWRYN